LLTRNGMTICGTGRIQIASYSFDPATRLLHRNGDRILLTRKAGDLLAVLLADVNSLVPRERIFAQVWPQGFMHEGNLTQTIYLLRRSLAADPAVSIENVPRRGYRLRVLDETSTVAKRPRARTIAIGVSILAFLVCVGMSMAFHSASSIRPLPAKAREDVDIAMYHFDRFVNLGLARNHFARTTTEAPNAPEGYAGLALVDAIDGFDSPERGRYCAQGRSAVARSKAAGTSTLGHVAGAMLSVTCDRSLTRARRELDAALVAAPLDATALTVRSRVALWQNQPRDAISFATKAVANEPTSPEALLALGIAYYYHDDLRNAVTTFDRLLELMPDRPAALDFLERSYEGLGNFRDANKTLREAQHDPRNASWVWPTRARLLALTGHRRDALSALRQRASTSDPESLAAAYAAAGNDRGAIGNIEIASARHGLGAQVSWLNDFRFAALRRKFPTLTSTLVTWR
jgi:DNA-binding winged helix-turn-helix (wHTH) protein/Flp pilus assembly protein TadD